MVAHPSRRNLFGAAASLPIAGLALVSSTYPDTAAIESLIIAQKAAFDHQERTLCVVDELPGRRRARRLQASWSNTKRPARRWTTLTAPSCGSSQRLPRSST